MITTRVGWNATHELEQDGPDAPQVSLDVILLVLKNLRRHVERGAAEGIRKPVNAQVPRETKVRNLQSRFPFQLGAFGAFAQEQVLRLEVPVHQIQAP